MIPPEKYEEHFLHLQEMSSIGFIFLVPSLLLNLRG